MILGFLLYISQSCVPLIHTILIQLSVLIGHLYLSCMWFVVTSRTNSQKICRFEEVGLYAQIMITISSSKVDIIGGDLYVQIMSTRIFAFKMI